MKIHWSVSLLALLVHSPLAAKAAPDWENFLGKWDLLIADSASSFRSCSLDLKNAGTGVVGELVWRWGSVWRFDDPRVATLGEEGELVLRNDGLWKSPLILRRIGSMVEGSATAKNGTVLHLIGTAAERHVDPTGLWDVSVTLDDGQEAAGRLEVRKTGWREYAARAFNQEGDELPVDFFRQEGTRLSTAIQWTDGYGDVQDVTLALHLRGDRLVGRARPADGSPDLEARGVRRRTWGNPVRLLPEKGLSGWRPRDASRPFRWTCEDGILTNGAHDVDIVSDAEFSDFRLSLRYKVAQPNGNSGVYLRGRYEVQIIGNDRINDHGNCAIYSRLEPKVNPYRTGEHWQELEVTLIDRFVTVILNGTTVHDNVELEGITGGAIDPWEHRPGPFVLQGDHGKILFKDIVVRPAL